MDNMNSDHIPITTEGKSETVEVSKLTLRFGEDALGIRYLMMESGGKHGIVELSDLMLSAKQLADRLLPQGITLVGRKDVETLRKSVAEADTTPTFRLSSIPGWIGKTTYAHGGTVIGPLPSDLMVIPDLIKLGDRPRKFDVSGNQNEWRNFAADIATGQPLIAFLLSVAFAAMILRHLQVQPFAVMLTGPTSIGKTKLATYVGSVFGGDPSRALGFADSFKVTDAGFEKVCLAHNDALVILDELSRVRGAHHRLEILEAAVTDLTAGVPKTTATARTGGLQWSTCGLITSNDTYAELLSEANRDAAENMAARLIELPVHLDPELGVFQSLPPGFSSSREAVKALEDAAARLYGWPARVFAEKVADHITRDELKLMARLERWKRMMARDIGAVSNGAAAHLKEKFCAVGAAGMLATRLGVLPRQLDVRAAVRWAWHASAGESRPKVTPLSAAAAYLREHRKNFPKTPLPESMTEADAAGLPGLNHKGENGSEYLIPKAAFNRAFKGIGGSKVVIPALLRAGLAFAENERQHKYQVKRKIARNLRVRLYAVDARILEHEGGGSLPGTA